MAFIEVIGIKEFQAALREADAALPRELKRGMDVIGREILLPAIIDRMEGQFVLSRGEKKKSHNARDGSLLKSLRAVSEQRAGVIKEGNARVPYAGWWEFGGTTHSSRGDTSREFIKEGRSVYPALDAKTEEIELEMNHLLARLARIIDAAAAFGE